MFLATLKELNLFMLPKPNFDIPASEFDPICPPRTGDSDLSCVSHTFDMQQINEINSNPIVLEGVNPPRDRRRNTIAFPWLHKVQESHWPGASPVKRPLSTPIGPESFPSVAELQDPTSRFSNGIASIMRTRSSETSSGAKVRIITPANSPSSIRRRLREDLSLYDCSPNRDKSPTDISQTKAQKARENKVDIRYGLSRKGKEKRNSAPPVLPSAIVQTNEPILPTRLPAPVVQKYQNHRLRSDIPSNPSYPSKLFELDLSPIIEDVYAFSDQLPAPLMERAQTDADSSTSSYGELLYDKSADYFGLSEFEFFGNLYHRHHEKRQWTETVEHRMSQQGLNLTSMNEETVKNRERRLPEDILPQLTLTLPTPDFGCSTEFINFDVEVLQGETHGELPRSYCGVLASVVDIDEAQEPRSSPPLVRSCYPDNNVFQTYDPYSYGTMDALSHLDPVANSDSMNRNVLDLDLSRNHAPLVGHPASLVTQNCTENAHHPCADIETTILDDPAARRLGNGFSRFGRYVLRRIKLFSLSGTGHKHRDITSNNDGDKELWDLKRVTRVFTHRNQFRDSSTLNNPIKDLKRKQAAHKGSRTETEMKGPRRHSDLVY